MRKINEIHLSRKKNSSWKIVHHLLNAPKERKGNSYPEMHCSIMVWNFLSASASKNPALLMNKSINLDKFYVKSRETYLALNIRKNSQRPTFKSGLQFLHWLENKIFFKLSSWGNKIKFGSIPKIFRLKQIKLLKYLYATT